MTVRNKTAATLALLAFAVGIASAQARAPRGLSLGIGAGGMMPADKESYLGDALDLYPEASIAYDVGIFLAEASVGWIMKSGTITYYVGSVAIGEEDYEIQFFPAKLAAKVMPFRESRPDLLAQPFAGLGLGCLVASGDNGDSYLLASPELGVSFGRKHILDLDLTYNCVIGEEDLTLGDTLDYCTFGLKYRYRFAFGD
ncbi:MAG TPA: hypothetical protein PLB91_11870 [Spirochaetales bacterium]|nr:hypothetical protein [Spirochaetales bacterium]HRY54633.1 hypothetical protein [Spirochaetia bacterium]HRZ64851.1 hypothetical protein [Spirochaetia bacterium]